METINGSNKKLASLPLSESASSSPKTEMRLENIVQNLYFPNEIEDVDGVDDGDLYPTSKRVSSGPTPESVAFLNEQQRYHENKETNNDMENKSQSPVDIDTKVDSLKEFNYSTSPTMSTNTNSIYSQAGFPRVETLLKERGLRSTVANRTPRDFFFIRTLGEGAFSTVYFAKEVDTGDQYAIKVLLKRDIRHENKVRYVLREKDVMASLTYVHGGHPFIVKLYCTFQDHDRLYFAITYAKHGELLDWLRRLGSFDETVCLFYAAEILVALEYIHKCGVIHRDLKPENILVGADWHILLSDFGTAKMFNRVCDSDKADDSPTNYPFKSKSTVSEKVPDKMVSRDRSSFVGTAQYVSPEVLKSEPVGPECDYWALGAIIFQMMSGQPPFRAVNEYQIMKKILSVNYSFPDGFSPIAKDLVKRLLVEKDQRLGNESSGGISAIKNHNYFEGVDWENLPNRTPPELKPYLPASSGEPAYHSDFQLPENLEPGLNEAALTRLMGLTNLFQEIQFNSENDNCAIQQQEPTSLIKSAADIEEEQRSKAEQMRAQILEAQRRNHDYHRFVDNNIIIKWGPIDKKKGLFARRRIFLLTEGPRLFYVDPTNMELKGEVPLSHEVRTEALNFRTFFVHTPKRTYYLFDPCRSAEDWCAKIDEVTKQYFSKPKTEKQ